MYFKNTVTIALVKYKGLKNLFFEKSLNSALQQIDVNFKVDLYLDGVEYHPDNNLINIKKVPDSFKNNPPKIREYIVNNTDSKYLAFWDSDDFYYPDRLKKQMEYIRENNFYICFSDFIFLKDNKLLNSFFDYVGYNFRKIDILQENI